MAKMNYAKLVVSIVICQLVGIISSVFTASSISTWYATLNQPFFNPPNWVFAPVWTTLYLLMGISLYLVWSSKAKEKKRALYVFAVQLGLNFLWSLLFFGLQNPLLALAEILLLWFSILLSILVFHKISKPASYLLIPYILWVSFAAVLNLGYVLVN